MFDNGWYYVNIRCISKGWDKTLLSLFCFFYGTQGTYTFATCSSARLSHLGRARDFRFKVNTHDMVQAA